MIAAIVDLIVYFIKNLLKQFKLTSLKKEAEEAKEKADETLEKERSDYDAFMHDASSYWDSQSGQPGDVPEPAEAVRPDSRGAAANDRKPGRPKRKAGSRNKRTRQAARRGKGRSGPFN